VTVIDGVILGVIVIDGVVVIDGVTVIDGVVVIEGVVVILGVLVIDGVGVGVGVVVGVGLGAATAPSKSIITMAASEIVAFTFASGRHAMTFVIDPAVNDSTSVHPCANSSILLTDASRSGWRVAVY